jgi:hypothetical protein
MSNDQTFFQETWLDDNRFEGWLAAVTKNKTQAHCTRCKKTFGLSNMGVQALKSHSEGKKHKNICEKIACFFKQNKQNPKPNSDISNDNPSASVPPSPLEPPKTQSTLELSINQTDKIKAEIRWALESVMRGNSNNSNNTINKLFQVMFPDSQIVKLFSMGPDKLRYVVNHGLAPYFHQILKEELSKTDCYVVIFDESMNDVTQNCEMDLLVRYWDNDDNKVKVRFWGSRFLGHATHTDLLENFNDAVSSLNLTKMLQVSMDGPKVNHKYFNALLNYREECELPKLIDIGSCSLHIIHGAFQTGATKSSWNVKKILKSTWQILHDSPARREDYETVTGSTTYPLAFCATRWVESKSVADRAVVIWPDIAKLVLFWEKLSKSKQPKSKSFISVQDAVHNPLTIAQFQFFSYIAGLLEPFLKSYQTDRPMLPFMYYDLKALVVSLLRLFIKSNIISNCKSGSEMMKINLSAEANVINVKDVTVGFAAETTLTDLKRKDKVNGKQVIAFKKDCQKFLIALVSKLFERIQFGSVIVRFSSIFDPTCMVVNSIEKNEKSLKNILNHFISLKVITPVYCDNVLSQFNKFLTIDMKLNKNIFTKFDRSLQRLDTFYFQKPVNVIQYANLAFVVEVIMTLSHGQASVERGFSQRNAMLKDNMKTDSMNSRRIIIDHMRSNEIGPESIAITNKLLLSVKSARLKYEEAKLKEKEKQSLSKKDNEKIILDSEIATIKGKCETLFKTSELLNSEFEACVYKAESTPEEATFLISKATAMKRKANKEKDDIKTLQEVICDLERKKRKLNEV